MRSHRSVHLTEVDEKRFWAKVRRGSDGACWEWLAARDRYGYGTFSVAGRKRLAHRVVLWLIGRSVDPRLQVDHLCRNKACVNPAHLEQVTQAENMRRTRGFRTAPGATETHCKRGHPYDEANTYRAPEGWRSCRTCRDAAAARYRARKSRDGNEVDTNGEDVGVVTDGGEQGLGTCSPESAKGSTSDVCKYCLEPDPHHTGQCPVIS